MSVEEDRQYMGTAEEAKSNLLEKAREWRESRQPQMATRSEIKKMEKHEHQLRFELANAALLWLWHEENPAPVNCNEGLFRAERSAAR